jgi:hypothetical protein
MWAFHEVFQAFAPRLRTLDQPAGGWTIKANRSRRVDPAFRGRGTKPHPRPVSRPVPRHNLDGNLSRLGRSRRFMCFNCSWRW